MMEMSTKYVMIFKENMEYVEVLQPIETDPLQEQNVQQPNVQEQNVQEHTSDIHEGISVQEEPNIDVPEVSHRVKSQEEALDGSQLQEILYTEYTETDLPDLE